MNHTPLTNQQLDDIADMLDRPVVPAGTGEGAS